MTTHDKVRSISLAITICQDAILKDVEEHGIINLGLGYKIRNNLYELVIATSIALDDGDDHADYHGG